MLKLVVLLALLPGCSDYDLHGSDKTGGQLDSEDPGTTDTDGETDSAGDTDSGGSQPVEDTNLGTNFLAVTTANALLPQTFRDDFAIVVTNPDEDEDANVTVKLGSVIVAETVVPPDQAVTIELPMVRELQLATSENVLAVDGAYEVESDRPIAAYQFNPLHYQSDAGEYSYTNDASMLLPEHVMGDEYMIGAWPTFSGAYPGFAAIVGVEDGTSVTIRSRTRTASGGGINAMAPGDEATITLDRGDVFQLFSAMSSGADLTGSVVVSSAPVAVFGGHQCTNVPLPDASCDHLEEMMQPVDTWGDEYVMTALSHPDRNQPADSMFRVVALNDNTTVSFDPAVSSTITLDRGENVEFTTGEDFVVSGSNKIAVYQYMQSCTAIGTANTSYNGDPSMGSGIPQRQARPSYVFLVPDTYEQNWANVVAEVGTDVLLDGASVTLSGEVGSSGYQSGRVQVSAGSHLLESADGSNITVTVYGYADFTSYLYPGGMNFVE